MQIERQESDGQHEADPRQRGDRQEGGWRDGLDAAHEHAARHRHLPASPAHRAAHRAREVQARRARREQRHWGCLALCKRCRYM